MKRILTATWWEGLRVAFKTVQRLISTHLSSLSVGVSAESLKVNT